MAFEVNYTMFPPKIHCVINCKDNTPVNEPLFYSGDLKFDTGADITCINAQNLNMGIEESEFTQWIQTHENLNIIKSGKLKRNALVCTTTKGIDKEAEKIKSYAYQVDDFTITKGKASVSLGSVPIFVTFDKRFQTPLLGRDLLSLFNIVIDNDKNVMSFELTEKFKKNKITPQYFINNGIYSRKSMLIEENEMIKD